MSRDNSTPQPIIATTDGARVQTSRGEVFSLAQRDPGTSWNAALLAEACARHGIAQLWCHPSAPAFALDDTHGWDFREQDRDDAGDARKRPPAWVHTFKRGTNLTVDLVRPELDRDSPWRTAPDAETLLAGLMLYRDVIGITFRWSPAATSRELLIGLHLGHKRNIPLTLPELPAPARIVTTETPLSWARLLAAAELDAGWIHSYDKNCAYLGVCSNLALGAGAVTHLDSSEVDEAATWLPGYFLVDAEQPMDAGAAPADAIPSCARVRRGDLRQWVTTPTLALMRERRDGWTPAVHEAYVWREHHVPLTPWYKRLRDARADLLSGLHGTPGCDLTLAAVKATYAAFAGGYLCSVKQDWDRSADVLYRPDIRHQIIAASRCNVVRKFRRCIHEAGVTPLGISGVDTLYIVSDEPDPVAACPAPITLGVQVRDWKPNPPIRLTPELRRVLASDQLAPTKRAGALKSTLDREKGARA